jgi:hypothetical protein
MTNWTYGMRGGEVWVLGAGTGIGKSDLAAEIVQPTSSSPRRTAASVSPACSTTRAARPHPQDACRQAVPPSASTSPTPRTAPPTSTGSHEDMEAARVYRRDPCAKLYINDHKGAIDWASVKDRLRFLTHEAASSWPSWTRWPRWSPKRTMTARRSTGCSLRPRP